MIERAGDRGRTGDVQLGNPFGSASKTRAVLGIVQLSSVPRAPGCPLVPRRTATETTTRIELSQRLVQVLRGQVRVAERHASVLCPISSRDRVEMKPASTARPAGLSGSAGTDQAP